MRSTAVTSAGTCAGRLVEAVRLDQVQHRLEQEAEHADRDRGGLRADAAASGSYSAQMSRIRSATSRRIRLRSALTSGDVPMPSSKQDARRGRIGDEVVDERGDADLDEARVGRRRRASRCAPRRAARADDVLQRAVHRVFAVVEERVERGAARVRAADDVFDRRAVIPACRELVDRGAHETLALIGAPLFGREPAVAPSAAHGGQRAFGGHSRDRLGCKSRAADHGLTRFPALTIATFPGMTTSGRRSPTRSRAHVRAGDVLHPVVGHTRWIGGDPRGRAAVVGSRSAVHARRCSRCRASARCSSAGDLVRKVITGYSGDTFPNFTPNPLFARRVRARRGRGRALVVPRVRAATRGRGARAARDRRRVRSRARRWRRTTAFARVDTPFGEVGLLAPLRPDVALLHAPIADRDGQRRVAPAAARRGVGRARRPGGARS